ncbi:hypothetical protein D1007_10601 [Hordeum vulgare]|nr:hypothetical protein D1007_10601 [Hordeum vulgare]
MQPTGANWNLDVCGDEMMVIAGELIQLKASHKSVSSDLVAAFISCRVLPLQERLHWICDMSLCMDPCRLSTMELRPNKISVRVNAINRFRLDERAWWFGMEPFYHENHAPEMMMDGANLQTFALDRVDSDVEDYK